MTKDILVIDNYDSFTYNLVHIIRELGFASRMDIYRNDKIKVQDVGNYSHILLSPGPGLPKDAGIMPQIIEKYGADKNILGVCLGHQAIGEVYGAQLFNLPLVYHGVATEIFLCGEDELYDGIPDQFSVCRYHSWVVSEDHFPPELEITARDNNGQIMALRHKKNNVRGVQFHPESIMTEHGKKLIENWMKLETI